MRILGLLAGLALPLAATAALLRSALPDLWVRSRIFGSSLAVLVALGATSLTYAFTTFSVGPRWPAFIPIEIGLWSVLLIVSLRRTPVSQPVPTPVPRAFANVEFAAALLFAVTLGISALHFYLSTMNSPSGVWDAQAIWNLRARFLSRGLEGHWRDAFQVSLGWSHPNYPLMLPSNTARLWFYIGSESFVVPVLVAFLFKYATVGVLVGALLAAGRRLEAFCAGAVLLASFPFNFWGVAQISDVPLGAFVLAATVLLSWIAESADTSLAGMCTLLAFCAGCAAWTKNEGLVFTLAICGVLACWIVFRRRGAMRPLILTVAGLCLPLLALLYFKRNLAPPSYLFESFSGTTPPVQVWDTARHAYILRAYARELWAWTTTRPVGLIPFVAAYAVVAPAFRGLRGRQLITIVPLIAMLAGYYGAYVVTPLDLKWHIESSLGRLIVQIWPAMVFVSFALAKPLIVPPERT